MHIEAMRPLVDAGKLGRILFQFTPWFRKNRASSTTCASFASGWLAAVMTLNATGLAS